MTEDKETTMTNIEVDVTGGAITCSPKGGHVRALHGTRLAWKSPHEQFTLSFEALDGSGTRTWPFVEPEPTWPVLAFQGTLKPMTGDPAPDQRPVYKYTVVIGNNVLDPIIIVDKN